METEEADVGGEVGQRSKRVKCGASIIVSLEKRAGRRWLRAEKESSVLMDWGVTVTGHKEEVGAGGRC